MGERASKQALRGKKKINSWAMQERGLDMHVPCTGLVRAQQLVMLDAGLGELGLAGLVRLWAKNVVGLEAKEMGLN